MFQCNLNFPTFYFRKAELLYDEEKEIVLLVLYEKNKLKKEIENFRSCTCSSILWLCFAASLRNSTGVMKVGRKGRQENLQGPMESLFNNAPCKCTVVYMIYNILHCFVTTETWRPWKC